MTTTTAIRVLLVDDSPLMRKLVRHCLAADPGISVVGEAANAYEARERLVELKPDVMILDIQMPKMDGITFLEKVMKHFPVRTLVLSALCEENSQVMFNALSAGAIDVTGKPAANTPEALAALSEELRARVKAAAQARMRVSGVVPVNATKKATQSTVPAGAPSKHLIAIGSSTGGVEALLEVLPRLPAETPGVVVVQHLPAVFTRQYADRLAKLCHMEVRVAETGQTVNDGTIYFAPGDFHLEIEGRPGSFRTLLHKKPARNGVRPSADFMMESVAKAAGRVGIGVILTGMGKDGTQGLLAMRAAGAFNIAQDEETSIVFGMPREAVQAGAIHRVLPLNRIADEIISHIPMKLAA